MGASDLNSVKPKPSAPILSHSPSQTRYIAEMFARQCQPNDVVGLKGTLGSGKTCFVKGMAEGLQVDADRQVTSPTFVLHKKHTGRLVLHHFDAYRLESAESMAELGCHEIFEDEGVAVIEWADHVMDCLPESYFMWTFRINGKTDRELTLQAKGENPQSRLPAITQRLQRQTSSDVS